MKYKHYDSNGKRMSKKLFDRLSKDPSYYYMEGVIRDKRHIMIAYRKGVDNDVTSKKTRN